jgi:hypothetical protein
MNNKIGIGIIDIYDDDSVNNILQHIPEGAHVSIATCRKSSLNFKNINHKKMDNVSLAYMKNYLLHDFRKNDLDYYFLLHSDQTVSDYAIYSRIIKKAETFGTWFLTGSMPNCIDIEDDNKEVLKISQNLNSKFIFTFKGIIKNNGFFSERYLNGQNLHVLDYIEGLRKKNLFLPPGYFPTISENMVENKKTMTNPYFKDFPDPDKTLQYAYGYFMHKHKYIPGQNDPKSADQDEMLKQLEELQNNYAKK